MDNNLTWFQSLIGTISLFGQFAVPLIFAIISFIRRKKYIQGSKNIYGKIFLHIVVTTIISTILLDIILLIFCMKIFLGSGNFGIFILPLFFIINLIVAIFLSIAVYILVINTKSQ